MQIGSQRKKRKNLLGLSGAQSQLAQGIGRDCIAVQQISMHRRCDGNGEVEKETVVVVMEATTTELGIALNLEPSFQLILCRSELK